MYIYIGALVNISAAVKRSIETHPVESRDLHKVCRTIYNVVYCTCF